MPSTAPESKLIKSLRTILSFILAIDIAVLGMSFCFSMNFLSDKKIEKCLTDYEYTVGVRQNFIDYTNSFYQRNGFGNENVESIISTKAVQGVVEGYAGYYITARVGFDEDSYIKEIDAICENLRSDMENQIQLTNQNNDIQMLDNVVRSIAAYFQNEVNIPGVGRLASVLNIGIPVSYGVLGVSLFLFAAIGLILIFLGEKDRRHRSISAVSISFLTAGIFEILLAAIVLIISDLKKFDIYPIYLYDSFMHYFYTCVLAVVVTGLLLIVISLAVSTLAWINKTKSKG